MKTKYNEQMAELFTEVFCALPLANVINEKVFVVHGGLFSSDGVKLSDIRAINRFREPPDEGTHPLLLPKKLFKLHDGALLNVLPSCQCSIFWMTESVS